MAARLVAKRRAEIRAGPHGSAAVVFMVSVVHGKGALVVPMPSNWASFQRRNGGQRL